MDFDEYDYLEKTVENPEPQKPKESANGGDELVKSGDKDSNRSSRRRGEDDDNEDHKSKRSRSGDDARGRDRDRERVREKGSSWHRSRSRERERSEKDGERRDRSSREHKDKDRDKEREREKDREERNGRDRDREKDRVKEKERERERDRDSGRKERDHEESGRERGDRDRDRRSRSHSIRHREDGERSRDREHRERSRDREHRERSRDRELREKSRDREYREKSYDRESRYARTIFRWSILANEPGSGNQAMSFNALPKHMGILPSLALDSALRHKERKEEATEPEADPERDQRTVFAYQLPLRADERDIFEFFSRAGKVRDVRLIMDRNSRRSKGVGYIEFYDVMSVPMAIALSGQPIRGQPVMVKPSEAEKNLVQSTSTTAAGLSASGAARKLYVGNLVPNITEDQLRVVFEAFGTIELVQLPRDEAGLCKGFAFIQFARLEDAKAALVLNGQLDIGGRVMKVSAVTDQPGMQDAGATTGDLDDDEGIGFALNASSRAELMKKLDRSNTATSVPGVVPGVTPLVAPIIQPSVSHGGLPGPPLSTPLASLPVADPIGVPSECLLLKNMFDPKLETEPDFDLDIKEDVQEECSKYGPLKHIFVDKNSEGFVYLKFDTTQAAMSAQRALHGRWFAGKMISATFMVPRDYEAKFPDSR